MIEWYNSVSSQSTPGLVSAAAVGKVVHSKEPHAAGIVGRLNWLWARRRVILRHNPKGCELFD